ncbi:hypothetical protein CONLIGDRAFT_353287 [Coniochaeta ligniaria NRRL 30616]|uniref:Uncharacterized protein n=1 Tax=Coniochaeta ligniaria NRRL 30616 TaxID=1408157 RepID=A0A1J7JL18_9PEZI|nr:hypothetical protein CONLIGDRAFT_353287 [Coniochaeta ligniaria NRRL 30616]
MNCGLVGVIQLLCRYLQHQSPPVTRDYLANMVEYTTTIAIIHPDPNRHYPTSGAKSGTDGRRHRRPSSAIGGERYFSPFSCFIVIPSPQTLLIWIFALVSPERGPNWHRLPGQLKLRQSPSPGLWGRLKNPVLSFLYTCCIYTRMIALVGVVAGHNIPGGRHSIVQTNGRSDDWRTTRLGDQVSVPFAVVRLW